MRNRRALLATCGLTLSLSLVTPLTSLAQDATPAAGASAQPTSCDAEPRDLDELMALWFDESGSAAATPAAAMMIEDEATLPDGSKPEDADIAAIDEITRQWLFCMNIAGDYARGFNLMTDNLVSQYGPDITNPDQDTPDEARALLEAQGSRPTPVAGPKANCACQRWQGHARLGCWKMAALAPSGPLAATACSSCTRMRMARG